MRKMFVVSLAAIAALVVSFAAFGATVSAGDVRDSLRAAGAGGGTVTVDVFDTGAPGAIAAVAEYEGPGLPARRSMVFVLDPLPASAVHASFIPGGAKGIYWTEPAWTDSMAKAPGGTQFLLWEEAGGYGVMVPLVGNGMRTTFEGNGRELEVVAESFNEGYSPEGRTPLFILASGSDVYSLVRLAYEEAFELMRAEDPEGVIGRPRWEKEYPEVFRYIGWCSWNSHYRGVTHDDIVMHAREFSELGFPMGWILIDDGWQSVNSLGVGIWDQGKLYLTGFQANDKFPGGLKETARILKDDYGVRWVGVWHTYQGYWNGVAADSELGRDYSDALMKVAGSDEAAVPDPRSDAGHRFWDDWYRHLAESGVDFTKVDNQSTFSSLVGHELPISDAMSQGQDNLQRASEDHLDSAMINCMEMNIDVVYQWRTTNIARSSGDYVPILPHNPRTHTVKNVMNALWISNMAYPDYDMWTTHDDELLRGGKTQHYHGVARAISGGPVYVTDKPGRERFEYVMPLILGDGRVIMADEPGAPAADSLFADPYTSRRAFKAFAKSGEGGIIGAWNVNRYELPVSLEVSPADIAGIEGDRFALREFFSGEMSALARTGTLDGRLGGWGVRCYSVMPIVNGFAPLGLVDKFNGPGTVGGISRRPGGVGFTLAEAGVFAAYCERRPGRVTVGGQEVSPSRIEWNDSELIVDASSASAGPGEVEISIDW